MTRCRVILTTGHRDEFPSGQGWGWSEKILPSHMIAHQDLKSKPSTSALTTEISRALSLVHIYMKGQVNEVDTSWSK